MRSRFLETMPRSGRSDLAGRPTTLYAGAAGVAAVRPAARAPAARGASRSRVAAKWRRQDRLRACARRPDAHLASSPQPPDACDDGVYSNEACGCGRGLPLLMEGR